MKKSLRKLIPTFVMLVITAALIGTSTFAWFSMNKTVTVTGMQVEVKSDNTYLLINNTVSGADDAAKAASIQEANLTLYDWTMGTTKVYPSAPALTSGEASYLTVAAGHYTTSGSEITTAGEQIDNATKAVDSNNWYTANATAPNAAALSSTTVKQLASFTDYVIQKTVYLTVAAGANNAHNLTVTPTISQKSTGNDVDAIKLLIVTGSNYQFINTSNNGSPVSLHAVSDQSITNATYITIDIYIYYDGNATNVYTNNAANLTGATISLNFNVDAVAAA